MSAINNWYSYQSLKYKSQGENLPELDLFSCPKQIKNKFAFFDLDGTLITRTNGQSNIYSETNPSNWTFLGPVLEMLKIYNNSGYQIIIISNQSRFNNIVEEKINQISNKFKFHCGFEPIFICATTHDNFRKPDIGIIQWIQILLNNLMDPNINFQNIIKQSFMCGDAVGEENTSNIEYHWSDVDYKFAKNAGLRFFEPKLFFGSIIDDLITNKNLLSYIPIEYNLYIMVGNQGSGKSTLAKIISPNPCHMDELKTIKRMEIRALENLKSRVPIVIDATHTTKEKRQHWINFSKRYNLTHCILWIVRDGRPFNSVRTENKVPEIAYRIYSKHFKKPTSKECPVLKLY